MKNEVYMRREFMKSGFLAAAGLTAGVGCAPSLQGRTATGERAARVLLESRAVRIPHDYDTLQDAVNEEGKWAATQGVRIILVIESGHRLIQNLVVVGGDYSHFSIRSEDDVVELDPGIVITRSPVGRVCLFDYYHCRAPMLDCLVDTKQLVRRAYRLTTAQGIIGRGAGIRNAEEDGIDCAHGSSVWILGGEATGCGRHNLHVSHGSLCSARTGRSNFSGATGRFPHGAAGTNVGFYHGALGTIARGTDCSNAAQDGINARIGAVIDATEVDASNAGRDAIRAGDGGTIHVRNSNLSNAGRYGIHAHYSSTIEARECDVSNAGSNGVHADSASRIGAQRVIARNCGGVGIHAGTSSSIDAANADVSGSKEGHDDIRVRQGGNINATGATGHLSQRPNQVTAAGIIYQE